MAVHAAALVALLALAQGWPPAASSSAFNSELEAAVYGVLPSSAGDAATEAAQLLAFREATARILEATHGWLNCLLSARPRPPIEISRCTEHALPAVTDTLVALSTAGWAARFKSLDELDAIRRTIQRMAEIRSQVHNCVDSLSPSLQVAGRCYTVL